jgi:hypothetical protein
MFNPVYFVTIALALSLTQVGHAAHAQSQVALGDGSSSSPPPPTPQRVTFNAIFDNKAGSLNSVACSDGQFGLAKRFPTFGVIPSFPFIGGAFDIVWNSSSCGSCWNITNRAAGKWINITAIDGAKVGFNIGEQAFKILGGNTGKGVLDVFAYKIPSYFCGLW